MRKEKHCKRVISNLLEAEVYVRFPVRLVGKNEIKQYLELQEVPYSNGVREEYVLVDYPVTEDSVNSYADSADYRTNPEVISQAQPRKNLGDVSEIQKTLRNDLSEMREMLKVSQETLQKLENLQKNTGQDNQGLEENKKSEV